MKKTHRVPCIVCRKDIKVSSKRNTRVAHSDCYEYLTEEHKDKTLKENK